MALVPHIHTHIHTPTLFSARMYSSENLKIITLMLFHKISLCCLRQTEKEQDMQRACCGCSNIEEQKGGGGGLVAPEEEGVLLAGRDGGGVGVALAVAG